MIINCSKYKTTCVQEYTVNNSSIHMHSPMNNNILSKVKWLWEYNYILFRKHLGQNVTVPSSVP